MTLQLALVPPASDLPVRKVRPKRLPGWKPPAVVPKHVQHCNRGTGSRLWWIYTWRTSTPESRAQKRAKSYTDMLWHIGVFIVINAFLWILDLVTGAEGIQWAYWITIFWGLALAFHVVAYLVGDSGLEERKYRKTLAKN
ncbi:MAG: 2TM domain-containing protein [Actinobacteria bacterium]|nr:2TM domain-containing protein [Actinomycetota bacterium]